jgi:altronate dehydratase small subunit
MADRRGILIHPSDDVAVAVETCQAGDDLVLADGRRVRTRQDVTFGFKVALRRLEPGQPVRKYGEAIGVASAPIEEGDVVHIHNLGGARGRGDLAAKESR